MSRPAPVSTPFLTPPDHPSVFPYCQVLRLKKARPQTHFFRNCEEVSSRAVSAPRKASEPNNIRVIETSFILRRCSDTLERSKRPSVSNPASCTIGQHTKGGGRTGSRLAALFLAQLLISPWRRETLEVFALAGWVTSKAREAIAKCQASRDFRLKS